LYPKAPAIGGLVVTAKRFLILVCACSMAVLLWPSDALAQRGGGGGRGGGGSPPPAGRGGGPSGGQGGYRGGGYPGGYGGYRGGYYYRPAYYRPYYPYYRPYYYSPYFYNGFYTSFYFGVGWYPHYASFGWGYPYYGYYGYAGYPYGPYPYPYPYPYPAYGYTGWSSARLEVRPRDAQVFVDGYFVGVVDQFDGVFQRLDLPPGEHDIAIYMPGYHTYTERTLFRPGESYHYKTILEPLPPGAPPEPKPQPQPRQQGTGPDPNQPEYGRDPYGAPPPRDPAPYGRTQPPPDRPGDRNRVEIGGGYATLSLRVQPADAMVTIDGQRWDSPEGGSRLVVQLAAGQHRIEVRKDGFRPYSTTITIRPGEPQTLNISLPQQDVTLRGTQQ
jgi:hypothetical protein